MSPYSQHLRCAGTTGQTTDAMLLDIEWMSSRKKLSSVNVGDVPKLVTKPLEAKTVCFFRREWSRSNAKTPLTRNLG